MYYMERLDAHTKKLLYNVPFVGTRGGDMEDVRDKMNRYGLKRDKVYCIIAVIFSNIKNIFWISRNNKRNYIAILLTICFTKRDTLVRIIVNLYHKKGHYQVVELLHKIYSVIKRVRFINLKKLAVVVIVLAIGMIFIKLMQKIKARRGQNQKSEQQDIAKVQIQHFEILNIMQNELGDQIINLVGQVRETDKYLAKKHFENYKELANKVLQELKDCEKILGNINSKLSEIEAVKDVEIYQSYHDKYSEYIVALLDLGKNEIAKEALEKYEQDNKCENYDIESVEDGRDILYDYLKKCIEYYNELDEYLIRADKKSRKNRKKIYQREYIRNTKTPEEIIKSYLD